jgi:hypothetical protein
MLMIVGIEPGSSAQPTAEDVAGALVTVASEHEMVVVHAASLGLHDVLAAMRTALPRFDIVGLVHDPESAADHDVVEGLLADGALPVLVVPEPAVQSGAAAAAQRLSADALIWLRTDRQPAGRVGAAGGIRLELAIPQRQAAA